MKTYLAFCYLFFWIHTAYSQSFSKSLLYGDDHSFGIDMTRHFQDSTKYILYLPSARFGLSQKGPKLTDYIVKRDDGALLIDPNVALAFAEEQNIVQSGGRINGIGFGIRLNNQFSIAASYGLQYVMHIDYPLEALDLYTAGNAFIFGERLDLSFKTGSQAFHTYSVSGNYQHNKLTLGVQASFLSGIADVSVERNKLSIEVAPFFYNITTDTDFQINTTDLLEYKSLDQIVLDYSGDFSKSFFSSNRGYSFSIFGKYQIQEPTSISFVISDIGKMSWNSDPENYTSSGIRSFGGVSLLDVLNPNVSISYQDSLEQLLQIEESQLGYETSLPISFDLGVDHRINTKLSLSGAGSLTSYSSFQNYSVSVAGHYSIWEKLSLTASIHHSKLKTLSVGIGASFTIANFHLYAYTNNISSISNQIDAAYTYGTFGISYNFGKVSSQIRSQKLTKETVRR